MNREGGIARGLHRSSIQMEKYFMLGFTKTIMASLILFVVLVDASGMRRISIAMNRS